MTRSRTPISPLAMKLVHEADNGGTGNRWALGLLILGSALLAPIVLYRVNPAWLYSSPGWLDTFSPIGIGLNYTDPTFLNDYYKISRLPWNLYEFVFHNLFKENVAHLALHLSLFIATALFCWRIGVNLFRPIIAVFLAVVASTLPLMIASSWLGGSDYQSAMASPLFFGVIAAISSYTKQTAWRSGFCAGMALAALLAINSTYLLMAPLLALVAASVVLTRDGRWLDLIFAIIWTAVGMLFIVALLCLINGAVGRGFLFFMPEFRYVQYMYKNPSANVWWVPLTREVILRDQHIGFVFACGGIAAVECVRMTIQRKDRAEWIRLAIHAGFVIEVLIWTAWQLRGHQTMLLPSYMAQPLYAPACLSIAALLDRYVVAGSRSLAVSLIVLPVVAALFIIYSGPIFDPLRAASGSPSLVVGMFLVLLYIAIVASRAISPALPLIVAAVLLPAAEAATAPPPLFAPTRCRLYPEMSRFNITSSSYLTRITGRAKNIFMWVSPDDMQVVSKDCANLWGGNVGDVAYSFTSLGHEYLDNPWPKMKRASELPLDRLHAVGQLQDAVVAVFATDESYVEQLRQRFREAGVETKSATRLDPRKNITLPSIYVLRFVKPLSL